MYNPYLHSPEQMLEPVREQKSPLEGIIRKLRQLDTDDLLVLLLIYLLIQDGRKDDLWPLLGALIYCIL